MSPRDERDLHAALRQLPSPGPDPDFFDRLTARLEQEVTSEGHGRPRRWDFRRQRTTRSWLAAVAAAVVGASAVGVTMSLSPAPDVIPLIQPDPLAVDDLQDVVLQPTDVSPDLTQYDLWTDERWSDTDLNPTLVGSRVLGTQLLSETNRQLLDKQVTVLGGARSEYYAMDSPGGERIVTLSALLSDVDAAKAAFAFITSALPGQADAATGTALDSSAAPAEDLEPLAPADIGDEAVAFRGGMDSRFPGTTQTLYVWRIGRVVLAAWAAGPQQELLPAHAALMTERLETRQ